jgi:DNA invertase Pin-like site-specific DNA recombinase
MVSLQPQHTGADVANGGLKACARSAPKRRCGRKQTRLFAAGLDCRLGYHTSPGGKAMFQMLGVFAEFERAIIQERVRAGLRRAKSEGKTLGRPRIAPDLEAKILSALKAPGRSEGVRKIAKRFGVDPGTVQRIGRPLGASSRLVAQKAERRTC